MFFFVCFLVVVFLLLVLLALRLIVPPVTVMRKRTEKKSLLKRPGVFTTIGLIPFVSHRNSHNSKKYNLKHGGLQMSQNNLQKCMQSTLRPLVYVVKRQKHKQEHLSPIFCTRARTRRRSAQDVQINRGGLGQALEQIVNLLNVESHVRFTLPAAQHQVVHLFGAGTRPLQNPALCDTLDHLQREPSNTDNVILLYIQQDHMMLIQTPCFKPVSQS